MVIGVGWLLWGFVWFVCVVGFDCMWVLCFGGFLFIV